MRVWRIEDYLVRESFRGSEEVVRYEVCVYQSSERRRDQDWSDHTYDEPQLYCGSFGQAVQFPHTWHVHYRHLRTRILILPYHYTVNDSQS